LEKYHITLEFDDVWPSSWPERSERISLSLFVVLNFVVKNGGIMELSNHFDLNYLYDTINIKIDKNKLDIIKNHPLIKSVELR
jgi:hypothetical protein